MLVIGVPLAAVSAVTITFETGNSIIISFKGEKSMPATYIVRICEFSCIYLHICHENAYKLSHESRLIAILVNTHYNTSKEFLIARPEKEIDFYTVFVSVMVSVCYDLLPCLKSLPKKGVGALSSVSTCLVYSDSTPSKQIIGQTITYNGITSRFEVGTQHSERYHVNVRCSSRCTPKDA